MVDAKKWPTPDNRGIIGKLTPGTNGTAKRAAAERHSVIIEMAAELERAKRGRLWRDGCIAALLLALAAMLYLVIALYPQAARMNAIDAKIETYKRER